MSGISRALVPAAIGGAGAVGLDIALGYGASYLPASLATGYGKVAVQVAGAFGLGFIASKALGSEKGRLVTMGALTVAAYSLIKQLVKSAAPTVPGLSGTGAYMPMNGMGAYMQNQLPAGMGWINPAPGVNGLGDMDGLSAYMPNAGSDGM